MKIALIVSVVLNVVLAVVAALLFVGSAHAISQQQADHEQAVTIYKQIIARYEQQVSDDFLAGLERDSAMSAESRARLERERAEFVRRGGVEGGSN